MAHQEMRDHRQAPVYPRGRHHLRPSQVSDVSRAADESPYSDDVSAACNRLRDEITAFLFALTDDELVLVNPSDCRVWRILRVQHAKQSSDRFHIYDEILIGGLSAVLDERVRRAALTGHQRISENARRRERRGELV